MRNEWGTLSDDFYAEWKQSVNFAEAERNAWKTELRIGQKVTAACDIEYSETSSRCIRFGTEGVVVAIGSHDGTWGIKFKGKRDVWYCVYDPDKQPDPDDGQGWGTEIFPVPEPETPPIPPDAYLGQLL